MRSSASWRSGHRLAAPTRMRRRSGRRRGSSSGTMEADPALRCRRDVLLGPSASQ